MRVWPLLIVLFFCLGASCSEDSTPSSTDDTDDADTTDDTDDTDTDDGDDTDMEDTDDTDDEDVTDEDDTDDDTDDSAGDDDDDEVTLKTIGGTLSNLGSSLTVNLLNNGGDPLTLTSSGSFTFATSLEGGDSYEVTVSSQPSRQTCTVTNGSGTVGSSNITNVAVACVTDNPRIFKTPTQFSGDLKTNGSGATGIAGADSLCMSASNYPGVGTYKALIADGTNRVACTTASCTGGVSEHTDWVLAASTNYFRSDGTTSIGTTTSAGIFSFNLTNAFSNVANGNWTGLNSDWTTHANLCGSPPWTSSSSSNTGRIGSVTSVDSNAISTSNDPCNFMDNLICVEQ